MFIYLLYGLFELSAPIFSYLPFLLSPLYSNHGIEDNEDLYDSVYQEGDDEIYEDIVSTKRRRTPHKNSSTSEAQVGSIGGIR